MKKFDSLSWIFNPYHDDLPTSMSTKASEELINLSEDTSLRNSFNRKQLSKFWLSVADNYPCLFDEAIKVLLPLY